MEVGETIDSLVAASRRSIRIASRLNGEGERKCEFFEKSSSRRQQHNLEGQLQAVGFESHLSPFLASLQFMEVIRSEKKIDLFKKKKNCL